MLAWLVMRLAAVVDQDKFGAPKQVSGGFYRFSIWLMDRDGIDGIPILKLHGCRITLDFKHLNMPSTFANGNHYELGWIRNDLRKELIEQIITQIQRSQVACPRQHSEATL